MDSPNVIPISIEDEMRGSYMDYAMSVIIGRALPDVRDGLKPVHRRILFAMWSEGLLSNRKFSKCAGVVGEVLKKYHPHGDSAVYDALVRLAQPWSMRYPLIDGQGNFGSIDGDSAAAYRYTESRMQALAETMLADIDKDTVDFSPNFDDSTMEPKVLPSRIPGLLINGAEGIAVGMASRIPPHNLSEVIAAALRLIENPDATTDDLMECVPGPDFPTGGIIYGSSPLRQIYDTGRGLLQLRSKIHVETLKGAKRENEAIIIDEVPFQTNKAKLVEKIAELVNDKKIEGISKLRDESDRRGMRVVIELKRDAVTDVVINQLFKLTPMQRTFGVIMLAIVEGRPHVLSLKQTLSHFLDHRRDVVVRRCRYELGKARARLHVLDGFRIALQNIDAIIELIKTSESTPVAKAALEKKYGLSEIQSQHILDMPLKRLTGLERQGIEEEHREISSKIDDLLKILSSRAEVDHVVRTELEEIGAKFGDKRRTEIEEHGEAIDLEDMIAEQNMIVTISHRGYAKRCSPSLYRAQRRGGKGVMGTKKLGEDDEDFVSEMFVASTHAYLLVFTTAGKVYWIKVYNLPETGRTARGRALVNMLRLSEGEKVSAILPVRNFEENAYVVMVTRQGYIKRLDLMALSNVRQSGLKATELEDGDDLIAVRLTHGERDCVISTRNGMAIRFDETDVRVMGRSARGVKAINLDSDDSVVNFITAPHLDGVADLDGVAEEIAGEGNAVAVEGAEEGQSEEGQVEQAIAGEVALLTICENGYGKRTYLKRYRRQNRAGKGLIDIKTTERNGPVVGSARVVDGDDVMLITTAGKVIRIPAKGISVIGRNTQGVSLINLEENEKVAAVARVADVPSEAEGADDLTTNGHADNVPVNGLDAVSDAEEGSEKEEGSDTDDSGGTE